MYLKRFISKLSESVTRIIVLILALTLAVPYELSSVFTLDLSAINPLAISQGYATGGSGSIGTAIIGYSGIDTLKSGFKIGVHWDEDMYVNPDTGDTLEKFNEKTWSYVTTTDSIFVIPKTDGNGSYWENQGWSVGYYLNGALQYEGAYNGKLVFTEGKNSYKSNPEPNGIFYDTVLYFLENDYNNFITSGYKDILKNVNNSPTFKSRSLHVWEYITGWSNETFYVQQRINEVYKFTEFNADNYNEWSQDPDKCKQYMARYCDMLLQLYAIGNNSYFRSSITKAIECILQGEFADTPFAIEIVPAVTISGAPDADLVICTVLEFIEAYLNLSEAYTLQKDSFRNKVTAEHPEYYGHGYQLIKFAGDVDIKSRPNIDRVSNWPRTDQNPFSWGITGITPGRMQTPTGELVYYFPSPSPATARLLQHVWQDYRQTNVDYVNEIRLNERTLYGQTFVTYCDVSLGTPTIGKIEALPDDYPIKLDTSSEDKILGENVTINIYPNVKTTASKTIWDNNLKRAQESLNDGLSDGLFDLYIKVTRQCDYSTWNTPADFVDATYETGVINKTLSIDQLRQFIEGNLVISQNVDLTSPYKVTTKDNGTYKVTFTYTMDLQLKGDVNGDGIDEVFKPASEEDKKDTASFIIPETMPERLRYVSTPDAYAELKNYGSGSNQSGTLKEDYEVMAGVPTTEQLYYAAGGSEFIVDVSFEYVKDEVAVRSYTSYIAGTTCEFHGINNDGMEIKNTGSYSKSGSVGGDIGGSWSVYTTNTDISCSCDVCSGGGSCGAGDWTVTIYAEYSNECKLPKCSTGQHEYIVNGGQAYSEMCAAIAEIKQSMDDDAKGFTWTAPSDGITRDGMAFSWSSNPGYSAPNGNPGSANCINQHGSCGTDCSGYDVCDEDGGCTHVVKHCYGASCSRGSQGRGSGTITGTWTPHYICGPCCSHHLPDIYDTWSQSWEYDTIKVTDAHIWRIDQAAAKGLENVIGPAVDIGTKYTPGVVAGTYGPYDNPHNLEDGIVGASLKSGVPNIFYNIAVKNSNELPGHATDTSITYEFTDQDGIGKATESSTVGRIRYNLNGNWTDVKQHDMVYYNLGTRTNTCDGMAKTLSSNAEISGGNGHAEDWGSGFIYNSFKGNATHHGHNSTSVSSSAVQTNASKGGVLSNTATNYWKSTQWNKAGQTLYPLNDVHYLQEHCDGRDGSSLVVNTSDSVDTSSNNGNLDVNTPEYGWLLEKRQQPMQATMISDYIMLQTTSGDQCLLYFDVESDTTGYYQPNTNTQYNQYNEETGKRVSIPGGAVSATITAEMQIPTLEITQETLWNKNELSSANWDPDHINIGGYNGGYDNPESKFDGTGNNEKIATFYDNDPAGVIKRPARPTKSLMLYSLPLNIITEIENQSYLVDNLESEVFWANMLHWSDLTSKSISITSNPLTPEYSVTDRVGDTDNFDFWNHSTLETEWGGKMNEAQKQEDHSHRGIIIDTKYSDSHDIELNGLIIQDPISTTQVALESLPDERDQRYANTIDASVGSDLSTSTMVCPKIASECEFAVLNCTYGDIVELGNYYFTSNNGLNSVTNNNFGTPQAGWTFSNQQLVAKSPAVRISIPIASEFGIDYQSGVNIQVEADITINDLPRYKNTDGTLKTRISQMLFGFQNYGLYVSTDGAIGFITNDQQYREATNITIQKGKTYHIKAAFSFNSFNSCDLEVNGIKAVFTASSKEKITFGSSDIGTFFNIGSMGSGSYGPRATYDNIEISKLKGSYNHTEDCYISKIIHPSGNNVHIHTKDCIATGTTTDNTPGTTQTFNYTGTVQSVTLQPGTYKLEAWGAQGGNDTSGAATYREGGYGGYSYGTYTITKPTTLYIVVGQKGPDTKVGGSAYNGGGYIANHGSGGGGATHIATASGLLSNLANHSILLVAGGGGGIDYGGSWARRAGGGGSAVTAPDPAYGNNKVASNTSGYSFGIGEPVTNSSIQTGSGGGGYYGGYAGISEDQGDGGGSSAGGGSGYADTFKLSSVGGSTGIRSGNGMVKITPLTTTVSVGYDKYKEMYENGQLTVADLKEIFGDAYETLFTSAQNYKSFSNFTSLSKFTNAYNCSLNTYSGRLITSITGSSPSFILNESIDTSKVLELKITFDNNTSAKKAKVYWSNDNSFSESDSITVTMEPNKKDQTISFNLSTAPGWTGTVNKFKICIPAESDKNYGNNISIQSINFIMRSPNPQSFSYQAKAQSYTVPMTGYYLLETWGASGGSGANGGYTSAIAKITNGQKVYVYTGGQGTKSTGLGNGGGYNGGGDATTGGYGGGGMTHITTSSTDSFSNSITSTTVDKGHWELDPTAGLLKSDDDSGGNLSAYMAYNLEAGKTYLFGVGRYSSSRTGSYPYRVIDPNGSTVLSGTCHCDEGDWSNKTYDPDCVWSFTASVSGTYKFYADANGGDPCIYLSTYAKVWVPDIVTEYTVVDNVSFNPSNSYIIAGGGAGSSNGGAGGGASGGNSKNSGFSGTIASPIYNSYNPDSANKYCWYQSYSGCGASGMYAYYSSISSPNPSWCHSEHWVRVPQYDYTGDNGAGGTQSSGYKQGLGQSATTGSASAGAGGGYWGGKVTNVTNGGAGGGSGYINTSKVLNSYTSSEGKVYTATTTNGINSGNGRAKITFIESAPGAWPSIDDIVKVIDQIPSDSGLFDCDFTPNTHICDQFCEEVLALNCNEPHHTGNHYTGSEICYDACMNDANHKNTAPINTADGSFTPGNFINIDYGFRIYFANQGDFYQSDSHGIGNLTNTRGEGYENKMDTFTWTRVKQVKLSFNAIYQGNLYRAGEWITLADKGDYLGEDGSPYNEKNWSNYGNQLYNDLTGNAENGVGSNLYSFYCVLSNNEQDNGTIQYRVFGINNTSYDSDCGDEDNFPTYTTNRLRSGKQFRSVHTAYNKTYLDVVGRIGNLALIDTGDYRFSNLFKVHKAQDIDIPDPTYYYVIDPDNIDDTHNGIVPNIYAELSKSGTIVSNRAGGGAILENLELEAGAYRIYVNGDGLTSSGLSIKAYSNWNTEAEITTTDGLEVVKKSEWLEEPDEASDNPGVMQVTTTVTGPNININSGNIVIELSGTDLLKANWDLRYSGGSLASYIVGKTLTTDKITWTLNVPFDINNFEIYTKYVGKDSFDVEKAVISRLNTDSAKELASSDHITNISVSDNQRVYYVILDTDTEVSISAISRGVPIEVSAIGVQLVGSQDENWIIDGIIRDVDPSQQNAYLTYVDDIRGIKVSSDTQYIDTYDTIRWAQTAKCMTTIPLDSTQNNISVLRDEALLVGYDLYASIGTIGNYYKNGSGYLQVIPEYYGLDINTGEFFPVDAYIFYDNEYYPINIWGLVTGEDKYTWGENGSGYDISTIYNFATILRWNQEKDRRMVTPQEDYMTGALKERYKLVDDKGNTTYKVMSPSGNNTIIGNAQFLQLSGTARTFVGGETTYGELLNYSSGNMIRTEYFDDGFYSGRLYDYWTGRDKSTTVESETGIVSNPNGKLEDYTWWQEAQRWHMTLGLASSSVFVRSGEEPTTENIAKLQTNDYVVLSTVDIRALGEIWNLRYEQDNGSISGVDSETNITWEWDIPEQIVVNGHTHEIPPALVVYQTTKNSPFDIEIISSH